MLLPGRAYSPASPLLDLSRQVALQHGWSVRQVWWDAPPLGTDYDARSWVVDQLETAVAEQGVPDRLLVVGKSLGSRSIGTTLTADFVLLTPLLVEDALVADVRAARARGSRVLLVGGTGDELWTSVAHDLDCEVLEVEGADHAMALDGDAIRTAEVLVEVTRAVDAFVGSL